MSEKLYLSDNGLYHGGDPQLGDIEVPERPDISYVWDYSRMAWIKDPTLAIKLNNDTTTKQLAETDIAFIREIDDIVAILIDKKIISEKDFAPEAWKKIIIRAELRKKIKKL